MENNLYQQLPLIQKKWLSKQRGVSLLEMLVASFLGLYLSGFFIALYLSMKNTFQLQKDWSEIQQKGRLAVHLFHRVLTQSGLGCSQTDSSFYVMGRRDKNQDRLTVYQCDIKQEGKHIVPVDYFIENKKLYFRPKVKSFRKRLLFSGVESMKIEYGITCEREEGICDYLPANRVVDWKKVRSISLAFCFTATSLQKVWHLYVTLPQKEVL